MSVKDRENGRIINSDFMAVALGGDMNCYGVARTFYEAYGLRTALLGRAPVFPSSKSKLYSDKIYDERLLEDESVIRLLSQLDDKYPGVRKFVFATNDDYVRLIIHNRKAIEDISSDYIVPVISEDLFDRLDDKDTFYEMCEEYGLPYPRSVVFDCANDSLKDFPLPFDYPIFIKPTSNVLYFNFAFPGKQKGYKIDSESALYDVMGVIQGAGYPGKFVFQEYIDGDDDSMFIYSAYCDKAGKVRMMSGGQILMHDRSPELIGNYNAIGRARDDELMDKLASFLEKIGFVGLCHFDVQYDKNRGGYVVFEINIRQGRSNYYMPVSGMNYARLMAEDYLSDDGEDHEHYMVADKPFIVSNVSRKNLIKAIGPEKVKPVPKKSFYWFQLAPYDRNLRNLAGMKMIEKEIMDNYFKYNL